ncbi:unnamed protein product [Ixodes persulcatus]
MGSKRTVWGKKKRKKTLSRKSYGTSLSQAAYSVGYWEKNQTPGEELCGSGGDREKAVGVIAPKKNTRRYFGTRKLTKRALGQRLRRFREAAEASDPVTSNYGDGGSLRSILEGDATLGAARPRTLSHEA